MDVAPDSLRSNHLLSWGALGLVALALFFKLFSRDPLANVPGPAYAKWTGLVAKYYWLKGIKPAYIYELHRTYGPIVRVGPQEVYVADSEATQKIFRIKNEFPKSQWYMDFVPGAESIFNTPDIALHRRQRRLMSSPLSESGLKTFLPQIEYKVNLAIQRMQEEYKTRGVTDVYHWWLSMTTDIIGELSFGESFKCLESGKLNQYVKDLQSTGVMGSLRTAFPFLFRIVSHYGIPLPYISRVKGHAIRMRRYATDSLQRHRDLIESSDDANPTIFSKLYKAENDESITTKEIIDNAHLFIVAGSDTTSNTLDFLVWSVCRNPEIQSKLVKEVEALPADFTYEDMRDNMPYLEQVIQETLRRYPSVPSGLPREVPEGGAELYGYHIPAGYTVAPQSYVLHRDPKVFPDPETFDPSRWEKPTKAMHETFMGFGGGSRICIGIHLAKAELRLGAAKFFKSFPNARISTREGMKDQDMDPTLFFLAAPRGHRCLMELE